MLFKAFHCYDDADADDASLSSLHLQATCVCLPCKTPVGLLETLQAKQWLHLSRANKTISISFYLLCQQPKLYCSYIIT